jgi:hypothetical protein
LRRPPTMRKAPRRMRENKRDTVSLEEQDYLL